MVNDLQPTGSATLDQYTSNWLNLFEIVNLPELAMEYRLLEVQGLPSGEHYDKNLNQLRKAVAYEIKHPVALVRQNGDHYLAIPANSSLPAFEQPLMPHVATLVPAKHTHQLDFTDLSEQTFPIAITFLQSALRAPFWNAREVWGSGQGYYHKTPLNARQWGAGVDVYPGFKWNLVPTGDGRLFVAVDLTVRYIDRLWLTDRLSGGDPNQYVHRHCLYHFGPQWYVVQLWGMTGKGISEQRFKPQGMDRSVDVQTYTQTAWSMDRLSWIQALDPNSPAIIYRHPGREQDRYGALALCKLTLSTADAEAAGLQKHAILSPRQRFEQAQNVVRTHFQQAKLNERPIKILQTPLPVERTVFPVPPQRFGHDRVLSVKNRELSDVTDMVPLEQFGRRRLQLLLDPQVGPVDTSLFGHQYILFPQSAPRPINEDFIRRFEEAMREVSGQKQYKLRRILYDDRQATTLYRQVKAIKDAIAKNGVTHGYALLILPPRAKRDLHNYMKRTLWPDMQFQCALVDKIGSYYVQNGQAGTYHVDPARLGKLTSYVRNCAWSMMVVNRKWSWSLAAPLNYDVYIGVDVLNNMAGFTFVYNNGQDIFFRNYPCKQPERLATSQMRDVLFKHLNEDLQGLNIRPRSIIIHRDGKTGDSELRGVQQAIRKLLTEKVLSQDVVVGVVDVRKTSADHIRIIEGQSLESAQNPTIGAYYVLNSRQGLICTTGAPYQFPGTAKPLVAVIVDGDLDIKQVLEDLFALSQLVFTAPDKCARLPVTIKLSDDFLEPIAGDADDEAAMYESDEESELDDVMDDLDSEFAGEEVNTRARTV